MAMVDGEENNCAAMDNWIAKGVIPLLNLGRSSRLYISKDTANVNIQKGKASFYRLKFTSDKSIIFLSYKY